jgi:hypothetical protein
VSVQLSMVLAAQRHRELIAHLAAEGSRLSKLDVMGIRRCLLADETGLCADEQQMRLAPFPRGLFWEGQSGLFLLEGFAVSVANWQTIRHHPRRRYLLSLERRFFLFKLGIKKSCFLEPLLVGALYGSSIRLKKCVLDWKTRFSPSEEIIAASNGRELAEQLLSQFSRSLGLEDGRAVENAFERSTI